MVATFETPSMKAKKANEKTQNKLNQIKAVMDQSSLDMSVINEKSVLVILDLYAKRVLKKVENGETLNDHDMARFRAAYDAAQYGHENKTKITRYRFNKCRQAEEQLLDNIKNESMTVEIDKVIETSDQTIQPAVTPGIDLSSFEEIDAPVEETVLPDLNVTPTDIIDMTDIEAAIAASISEEMPDDKNTTILNIVPNHHRVLDDTQTNMSNQASRTPFNDNLRGGLNDNTNLTSPKSSRWSFKNLRNKTVNGLAKVAAVAVITLLGSSVFSPVSDLETAEYSNQQQLTIEVAQSQTDSTATKDVSDASIAMLKSFNVDEIQRTQTVTDLDVKELSGENDAPTTFDGQSNYTNSAYLKMQLDAIDGWKSSANAAFEELGKELPKKFADIVEKQKATELASQNHPSQNIAEASSPAIDETSVASVDADQDDPTVKIVKTQTINDFNTAGIQTANAFSLDNKSPNFSGAFQFQAPTSPVIQASLAEQSESDKSSTIDTSDFSPSDIAGEELGFTLADFSPSDVAGEELAFNLADFSPSDVAGEELAFNLADFNKSDVAGEELAFNLADFSPSDVADEELAFNLNGNKEIEAKNSLITKPASVMQATTALSDAPVAEVETFAKLDPSKIGQIHSGSMTLDNAGGLVEAFAEAHNVNGKVPARVQKFIKKMNAENAKYTGHREMGAFDAGKALKQAFGDKAMPIVKQLWEVAADGQGKASRLAKQGLAHNFS